MSASLIFVVTSIIVFFLAKHQNKNLDLNSTYLDDDGDDPKLRWAYQFSKTRARHFTITLILMILGVFLFGYGLSQNGEIVGEKYIKPNPWPIYLGAAMFLGGFVYFLITIGTKNARYNLIKREYQNFGIDIRNEFKKFEQVEPK